MGGSGSTRRVVVEEVDGSGVVKISDSVVKRIRGEEGGAGDAPPTPSPNMHRPPSMSDKSRAMVQDIESFYTHRLRELEDRNSELQKITNEQFVKAVQEVEQKFLKHTSTPVCQNMQSKVYECYLDNPKQTLNCSAQVRAFSTCVERARQNALLRKS
ncbi:hypothetical protein ACOMHN_004826 [Nucella lapillus]